MNHLNAIRSAGRYAIYALVLTMTSIGARAQDTTTESIQHGAPSYNSDVRNAGVVYVEGNDLVLKLENGKVEHLVVPDSDKFTIGGKDVTVRELTPGTKLTQTIITSTTPRYVNTIRTIQGKVWHVNAPSRVIVALPDGTHQPYTVPSHAKFIVDGRQKTVFDLRKGMKINATIITDSSETVVEQSKIAVGEAPAPATPQLVGVLLVQQPRPSLEPAPEPETVASAEQLAPVLPKTGTALPFAGFLGALSVVMSVGLGVVRKKFTV